MGETREQKIIRQLSNPASVQKRTAIATDMFLPNHSGDHSAGHTGTPTQNNDLVNKAYVDSVAGIWTLNGTSAYYNDGNVGIGTDNPLSIVHIRGTDLGLAIDDFPGSNSHGFLTVEEEDARLGLFSKNEGGHGSTIIMAEVNAGTFQDEWSIGRLSSGFDSKLEFNYGLTSDFTANTTRMHLTKNGTMFVGGFLGVGKTIPTTNVHVYGSNPKVTIDDSADTNPALYWAKSGSNKAAIDLEASTNDLRFFTNDGTWHERMTIEQSGHIGIGTSGPASSAIVDITSTTGALLIPRMTTTQRNALTAVNGMLIYNSTDNKFQGYEASSWANLI